MRKNELTTEVSHLRVHYSVRGVASYSIEVLHQGLHKHRLIRGPDSDVIEAKVRLQVAEWDAAWAKKVAADEQVTMAYRAKETAAEKTAEAQATMHALGEVLVSSLADSKVVDFEKLKDRAPFPKAKPAAPKRPAVPEQPPIPEAPFRTAARY